jgi:hypothetical protein
MTLRDFKAREQGMVPSKRLLVIRIVAFCLLLGAIALDYAASVPELKSLPAVFCQRLGHHSRPALAGMACCPLPTTAPPARRSTGESCCEKPATSQDAIPAAKQGSGCDATCCMQVVSLPAPPRRPLSSLLLLQGIRYERAVFDLKMDMRI